MKNNAELIQSIQELRAKLPYTSERRFDRESPYLSAHMGQWEILTQNSYSRKICAINKRLTVFAKLFSEDADAFASSLCACLQELSALSLSIPILPPLLLSQHTLLFQLGKYVYADSKKYQLTQNDLTRISAVTTKYSLQPSLTLYTKPHLHIQNLDLVKLGKKVYVVDPIVDMPMAIR